MIHKSSKVCIVYHSLKIHTAWDFILPKFNLELSRKGSAFCGPGTLKTTLQPSKMAPFANRSDFWCLCEVSTSAAASDHDHGPPCLEGCLFFNRETVPLPKHVKNSYSTSCFDVLLLWWNLAACRDCGATTWHKTLLVLWAIMFQTYIGHRDILNADCVYTLQNKKHVLRFFVPLCIRSYIDYRYINI